MDGLRQRVAVAPPKAQDVDSSSSSESGSDDGMVPFTPPNFTIKELLSAIPPHCFERSALRSFSYVFMDLFFIGCLVYAATFINGFFGAQGSLVDGAAGQVLRHVAWMAYAFGASLPGTGLWVIAHECGHQAFSTSKTLNNAVGWVLHSSLLVPYHSWRISHAKHHAATGHLTRDQVFIPKTRSQRGLPPQESTLEKMGEILEDAPLYTFTCLVVQQLFGWPMYILRNASGQKSYPHFTNHINPYAIIFDARHRQQVIMSDIGIGITIATLAVWGHYRGSLEVMRYYVLPYLLVNHWLVAVTFLQHTDPLLPHYREGEWDFVRGALCTVDRQCFGFFFHWISETHVLHHTVSRIPHYNAHEATDALKAKLGEHYHFNPTSVWQGLWDSYSQCHHVDDEGSILAYKDPRGNAKLKIVQSAPTDSGIELSS